jgi:hypothetical protein
MMMSLNQLETQALGSIADGLAGSDPRLASMLTIFSRLAADEKMPAREKTRVRRGRRHPRRHTARPQPRRLHPRLGRQQAVLVLGAVIFAALLTAALALNASGHRTCARSMGTACTSSSISQQADAGRR